MQVEQQTEKPTVTNESISSDPLRDAIDALSQTDAVAKSGDNGASRVEDSSRPGDAVEEGKKSELTASEYYTRAIEMDRDRRELKKQIRELQSKLTGVGQVDKQKAKSDPIATLESLGLTLDDVFTAYVGSKSNESSREQIDSTESSYDLRQKLAKIDSMERELGEWKTRHESERFQSEVSRELGKLQSVIDQSGDKYKFIKLNSDDGSLMMALQTAAEIYKRREEVPDIDEVLDLVENHYRTETINRFERAKSLGAMDDLLAKWSGSAKTVQQKIPSNNVTLTNEPSNTEAPRELTPAEAFQAALKAMGG